MDRLDIARIKILEDRDQRAACDLVGDAERADARDADPGGGELPQRLAIVRLDIAPHRQGELAVAVAKWPDGFGAAEVRSEEHTSELQSLMRISYAVFCLKQKKN